LFNLLNFTTMATTNYQTENQKESMNNRMHDYREHLKTITNGLVEMAKASGREDFSCNQLLRECYNLVNVDLDTFDGWKARGGQIRKGQHAYLFWGKPIESNKGYSFSPVSFLFAKEQVSFSNCYDA